MSANTCLSVAQLTSGDRVDQVFLISQPQLRTTSKGDYYIAAFLSDKTGKVNSRMWQATEAIFQSLPDEGFVHVRGRVEQYQNALQIVVDAAQPVDAATVDLDQFMPSTQGDVDQMFSQVTDILTQIKNPHLVALTTAFLADEHLMARFRTAPAAIAMHHAYLGGLLEHTLATMRMGVAVTQLYPKLDKDIILTALFLHDIGKTSELTYDISFRYTDQGRLIGHIVKGTMLIQEKIDQLNQQANQNFPAALADMLEHIILSHHGIREYGCPVLPAIPEAFAVHHIDNLDSKIALTFKEIDADINNTNWTNFLRSIDSPLCKTRPSDIPE
ncbi:MAG: HD domain-containing protein [Sedimentisphaerales bacterium]|nr:HD domain-containing protein [Sedimentisphaerales bacterium]